MKRFFHQGIKKRNTSSARFDLVEGPRRLEPHLMLGVAKRADERRGGGGVVALREPQCSLVTHPGLRVAEPGEQAFDGLGVGREYRERGDDRVPDLRIAL